MKELTIKKTAKIQRANAGPSCLSVEKLKSCRLQFQNPANFEVTALYITRTDRSRFRVKVFRGGACLCAIYVVADDFAELLSDDTILQYCN